MPLRLFLNQAFTQQILRLYRRARFSSIHRHHPRYFAEWFFLALAIALPAAGSNVESSTSTLETHRHNEAIRPNIVLFLFDDAGYSDMSAFGGEVHTPNIMRIVREGMTVKRFYTTARCSPTRAGILSGRYPQDVGMADLAGPRFKTEFKAYQGQLPLGVPLISELLQAAGYRTYLQGKWHLGGIPGMDTHPALNFAPNVRGFDEFIGFMGPEAPPFPSIWFRPYYHNKAAIDFAEGWYSVAGLNDKMIRQMSEQFRTAPETPFFVFFSSQTPHEPLAAPKKLIDKYRNVYAGPLEDVWKLRVSRMRSMRLFPTDAPMIVPTFTRQESETIRSSAAIRAAMIESSDSAFGKLLQLLEDNGKLDNTLIIVASDNGASTTTSKLTNAPFRGAKGVLAEGGTLSPLVARWPAGKVQSNQVSDSMSTYLDLMPTFLHVAGVEYPKQWRGDTALTPLEGRNLLPLFRGEKLSPPEDFYWDLYHQFAVLHEGRWKLLGTRTYNKENATNRAEYGLQLYDLLLDPAETKALTNEQQAMTALLLANYHTWAQEHGVVSYNEVLEAYKNNPSAPTRDPQKQY
jgi:arylsulfatase A-like enzyme